MNNEHYINFIYKKNVVLVCSVARDVNNQEREMDLLYS